MAVQMTDDEILSFLTDGARTGKLATTMADGSPHVMPVWFIVEDRQIVLNTGADTVKGRNLRRDPRAALLVDDEAPPYAFVQVRGRVALSEEPADLLRTATAIGGRYMGADRADEFGRRNGVPGELVVRIAMDHVVSMAGVSD